MFASLKLASEVLEDMKSEWDVSSDGVWKGVHRSTKKVITAETESKLADLLRAWTRELYMAVC